VARGVDPLSDRPVYKQIADSLRASIESGEFQPGSRLPSEAQLVEQFQVSQGTVRQALSLLRGQGLAVAEHGRGVFVRTQPKIRRVAHDRFARRHRDEGKAAYLVDAEQMDAKPAVDVFFVGPEKAGAAVAGLLRLEEGEQVLVRRRRYSSDDQPTELATSYVPWELASGTQMTEVDSGPGGIYARIEERGHRLGRFTEDVSARMPTVEEVRALRLAPGTPVLTLVRVAYDTHGRPVEVCDTVMSADHFLLTYELPAD
jgi:GntR family transcriptional regulator